MFKRMKSHVRTDINDFKEHTIDYECFINVIKLHQCLEGGIFMKIYFQNKNKLYSNLPLLYQHMFLCVNESTHFNWVVNGNNNLLLFIYIPVKLFH